MDQSRVRFHNIPFAAIFAMIVAFIPCLSNAQTWGDSLSHDERFWGRTGGFARQLALGNGGFGMLADAQIKTLAVNPFSVDPLFVLQNPAYGGHYPGLLTLDVGQSGATGQSFTGLFSLSHD